MTSRTPTFRFIQGLRHALSEAHPIRRFPVTQARHALDNGVLIRHTGRSAALMIPSVIALFGWPYAAAAALKRTGI